MYNVHIVCLLMEKMCVENHSNECCVLPFIAFILILNIRNIMWKAAKATKKGYICCSTYGATVAVQIKLYQIK